MVVEIGVEIYKFLIYNYLFENGWVDFKYILKQLYAILIEYL